MFGIFINCKEAPFVNDILSRCKLEETRPYDVLRAVVGKRVALIETGTSPVGIIHGYATITGSRIVSYDDIPARKSACIYGTPYDIMPGETKVFYKLSRVRPCKPYPLPENHINHGRSFTEFSRPRT